MSNDADDKAPGALRGYLMVRIEWADACLPRRRGWVIADEIEPTFSLITSIGFLVRETPEFVTLASSFTEDNPDNEQQFCEIIHIPVGSMRSMKRLRVRDSRL